MVAALPSMALAAGNPSAWLSLAITFAPSLTSVDGLMARRIFSQLRPGNFDFRIEAFARGVSQQTGAELPRGGTVFQVFRQVGSAHEQFAVANLAFEDQAEFAVRVPVVNRLHDRLQILRQIVQHDAARRRDNVLPLPVLKILRREIAPAPDALDRTAAPEVCAGLLAP